MLLNSPDPFDPLDFFLFEETTKGKDNADCNGDFDEDEEDEDDEDDW